MKTTSLASSSSRGVAAAKPTSTDARNHDFKIVCMALGYCVILVSKGIELGEILRFDVHRFFDFFFGAIAATRCDIFFFFP